jgi:hypothetical protein
MSHQDARATAQQVIRDLLAKHPPGFVVMVIRALTRMQRANPDITVFSQPQKPGDTGLPTHPPRE